ncbi:ATP-binding cassette domain-containing protein [Desertimonas flava]|uniref:branched-chain amino acid ABC transporter ATP-binding protein/permease n=1 Tax=Desertimonas flava TaxID=2064846 RepID=UPI000E351D3A|nr:branched-chain amino acid ABC transporter ATP-binding protein/permease [Desertimonas flava]
MTGLRPLLGRLRDGVGATAVLFAALVAGCWIYTSTGGAARDLLVQELLINLVLVLGLQIFIGNTGILSFGHLAFTQIAAYGTALTLIPAATKATSLPDIPFDLGGVELGPVWATTVGVVVAVLVGGVVGTAIARAGGLAATMISLAVLFVVDQVVKSWQELTRGAGGLASVPRLATNTPLWVVAAGALAVAHLFRTSRTGRFAVAGREDEIAAPAIGISLFWTRWMSWVASIAVVAVAGALRVQAVGSTNPKQYTLDVGVLLLAMLVAGGMRTVSGAFVGTVVITVGNEAARQFGDRHEIARLPDLFLGVVLLAVMLLRPGGLLGDADLAATMARWWRGRDGPVPAAAIAPAEAPTPVGPLSADDVVVRFGGFLALDGAGFRIGPGEVVGLIGPNGAGKTTLFNVVTGIVPEQSGRVRLGDRDLTAEPPHRIARAGLARTFQNLRLFANLPVRENVELAAVAAATYRSHRPGPDVDALLADAGLADVADRPAHTLDYGNQRRLELARAAAMAPDYLLLDEPTSGMSDEESLAMVDQVRATARGVGAGVLVIDHDLAFITRISDHVVVLAEGRVLAEGTPDAVRADPAVAAAYLGAEG